MKNIVGLEHAMVVDVRTPQEFAQAHYPGAINIPLEDVLQRLDEFKQMAGPIIAYCRVGNRSGVAVSLLKENGIDNVYNGGGLEDLLQQSK